MPSDSTVDAPRHQEPNSLICSDYHSINAWLNVCPRGRCLTGWSLTLDRRVFIGTCCGAFSCPHCGPRKQFKMAIMCELACPTKLITLTVNPSLYKEPREAYDETRRQISEMTKKLRAILEEFEYLRVLETTTKGWPHYHLVARCPFIKQHVLSKMWKEHSGAPIVDIRSIDQQLGVFGYVCKYLGKQESVPWTKRRISWTRNFFKKAERADHPGLQLQLTKMHRHDLATHLEMYCKNCIVTRVGGSLYIIEERRDQ